MKIIMFPRILDILESIFLVPEEKLSYVEIYKDTLLKATQYKNGITELFRLGDHSSNVRRVKVKVQSMH